MHRIEQFPSPITLFVFDLEFIGNVRKLETCRLWEVAFYCVQTQQWFDKVIDPDPNMTEFPEPPIPAIPQLTRDFLTKANAQTWDLVFPKLRDWVRTQSAGCIPVFVSHNTFRADKPILEYECQRCDLAMPFHWYFFDSLHFSRQVIRNSSGNYSLSGLHEHLFGQPIEDAHRAKSDVIACVKILQQMTQGSWMLNGPIYPTFSTSLRTVRWVGRKAEQVLHAHQIYSLEELFLQLQRRIRTDYIIHRMEAEQSVKASMNQWLSKDIPPDNIMNITSVILDTMKAEPFSQNFVSKSTLHLRSGSPCPK